MKASSILCLVVLIAASLAAVLPARAGELLRRGRRAAWNTNYYDPAWGMPEAVVVPPTVRWQSNYAWGVGGSRVNRVGARYQAEVPGPESAYNHARLSARSAATQRHATIRRELRPRPAAVGSCNTSTVDGMPKRHRSRAGMLGRQPMAGHA